MSEYLKTLKDNAERLNAKFVSFAMNDCKSLDGWNVSITLSSPELEIEEVQG